ncbi:MAG: polymerase subunit sigma-24 [Labilithrix sp.]|nr:polymerase subunit sigma-24 [Labilithrix sp.]
MDDDPLRLVFTTCHPILPIEARVALTLHLAFGLTTSEIARAFLVSEPTIAERVAQAKRTLAEARLSFEIPRGDGLEERLSSVLGVVYLIFNEGYTATAGDDLMRPALCHDAIRLGRKLTQLVPEEPEVFGLVALMELQAARTPARVSPSGEPIPLLEQERGLYDQFLTRRGLASLARADVLERERGPFVIQAEIAACHTCARTAAQTNWSRISELYAELVELLPSAVIELNRAVAVSMAEGPEAALALVDSLASDPSLEHYHLFAAARGDFLAKLGRLEEARAEFERAASLTRNTRERTLLLERAAACIPP